MPRTLYVHVGPKKTGTTAIQNLLHQHDNSTVIYPKAGRGGETSHRSLVLKFFESDRGVELGHGDGVDQLFQQISRETNNSNRDVLISSESLESRDVGAFIRAMLPIVGGTSMNVEILVAYRDHFSRAASWYSHSLRGKSQSKIIDPPDEYLEKYARKFCYAPLLQRLKRTGFAVTVLNYEPCENWVARFLLHIGFQDYLIPQIETRNVGLSSKMLVASLATKNIVRSDDLRRRYLREFGRMSGSRAPSTFIFSDRAAAKYEQLFGVDREFLWDEYGIPLAAPRFGTQENGLSINNEEFADIAAIARKFGTKGEEIIDFVRRYLRADAGSGSALKYGTG